MVSYPVRHACALVALAVVFVMTSPSSAAADVPNVGVVDMLRVTDSYTRYAEARKQLETRKMELQSIVDEEEKSVLALLEELETVRATATQEEIMRRRRAIEARDRELREFVGQTNFQFRDELDTLQFRTKDEIETVVQMVARRLALTLILEKNMTLFAADALDVTAAVIAELNTRFRPLPAAASAPTRAPRPSASTPPPSTGSSTPRSTWSTPPTR